MIIIMLILFSLSVSKARGGTNCITSHQDLLLQAGAYIYLTTTLTVLEAIPQVKIYLIEWGSRECLLSLIHGDCVFHFYIF